MLWSHVPSGSRRIAPPSAKREPAKTLDAFQGAGAAIHNLKPRDEVSWDGTSMDVLAISQALEPRAYQAQRHAWFPCLTSVSQPHAKEPCDANAPSAGSPLDV